MDGEADGEVASLTAADELQNALRGFKSGERDPVVFLRQLMEQMNDAAFLKEMLITGRNPRLNQYLGIPKEKMCIEPYTVKSRLNAGNQYLLRSGGLTDMVSLEEMEAVLKTKMLLWEKADTLLKMALYAGGRDNITFILIG